MRIRAVRTGELSVLQDIERAAGQCFRDIGMPDIADDPPLTVPELARYQRAGRAWAAVNGTDVPVAYLIADHVDGNLHVEQVCTRTPHAEESAAPCWTISRPGPRPRASPR